MDLRLKYKAEQETFLEAQIREIGPSDTDNDEDTMTAEGSQSEASNRKYEHHIRGVKRPVCRRAFTWIYCMGQDRYAKLKGRIQSGVEYVRLEQPGRPQDIRTLVAIEWMDCFFKANAERLPNRDIFNLSDNYTKFEVYTEYKDKQKEGKCSAVSYTSFTRIWDTDFPKVKIPATNRFSACKVCAETKEKIKSALTPQVRGTPL